jgi:hypothetical protein
MMLPQKTRRFMVTIIENLKESAATQRGKVFTMANGLEYTIWEEPEDEYLERMSKL